MSLLCAVLVNTDEVNLRGQELLYLKQEYSRLLHHALDLIDGVAIGELDLIDGLLKQLEVLQGKVRVFNAVAVGSDLVHELRAPLV